MSCWIMGKEPLCKLASYTADLLNMGFNFFGMEAPKSLYLALADCSDGHGFFDESKIYNELLQLNIDAVNGRYKDEFYQLADFEKFSPATAHRRPKYRKQHYTINKWMLEMSKRLACFNYQTEEDATSEKPLRKSMIELERALNAFIVHNMQAWQDAQWGE